MIYFIRNMENGHVKIGTSRNPWKRLQALQTASSQPFRLLGIIHGGKRREAKLHERFAAFRIRGEWFYGEPEILLFIRRRAFLFKGIKAEVELDAVLRLIALAKRDGRDGFSVKDDPNRKGWFKDLAERVFAAGGLSGMQRVYNEVCAWAGRHLDRREASFIASRLDWRFDGTGGWFA